MKKSGCEIEKMAGNQKMRKNDVSIKKKNKSTSLHKKCFKI